MAVLPSMALLPAISAASYVAQLESGYATEVDGAPFLLVLDSGTGATVLQPVRIIGSVVGTCRSCEASGLQAFGSCPDCGGEIR